MDVDPLMPLTHLYLFDLLSSLIGAIVLLLLVVVVVEVGTVTAVDGPPVFLRLHIRL